MLFRSNVYGWKTDKEDRPRQDRSMVGAQESDIQLSSVSPVHFEPEGGCISTAQRIIAFLLIRPDSSSDSSFQAVSMRPCVFKLVRCDHQIFEVPSTRHLVCRGTVVSPQGITTYAGLLLSWALLQRQAMTRCCCTCYPSRLGRAEALPPFLLAEPSVLSMRHACQ